MHAFSIWNVICKIYTRSIYLVYTFKKNKPGINLLYTFSKCHIPGIYQVYNWHLWKIWPSGSYTWCLPCSQQWVCPVPVTYPNRHVICQVYRIRDWYRTNPFVVSMVDTRYMNQMVISLEYVKYIPGIYHAYITYIRHMTFTDSVGRFSQHFVASILHLLTLAHWTSRKMQVYWPLCWAHHSSY